jgi:hypothetical protein
VNAARLTRGRGSSSWPTISVNESKNSVGKSQEHRNSIPLGTMAAMQSWPTPNAQVSQDGESPETWLKRKEAMKAKGYNGNGCGTPLTIAVQLHGQAGPASSSSHGSRQELSWPTPQTMDTLPVRPVEEFAETNKTRGGRKNRKALSNLREAVHSPVYQASWRTPQANEAGAKVETLFTKEGAPAMPGQRAYRLTPSGKLVLQSQTINQQVEMVENWATPQAHDAQGPKTPEQIAVMRAKGHGVRNLNEQATWATPQAKDHKSGHRDPTIVQYKQLNVEVEARATGKLNPRWVETLMGLPIGWTMPSCTSPQTIAPMSCDSSAMELCQPPQSELSEFSLAS